MSFWKRLKKVVPYISQGAVIASNADKDPTGAALATVDLILSQKGSSSYDAVKAVAVAVDDHEGNIKALQQAIALMAGAAMRGDTAMLQSIAQSFSGTPHMGEPLPTLPPVNPKQDIVFSGPPKTSTRQSDK